MRLEKELPVIILAGGLGTRLYPITEQIPKPMVPIGEKPFLEYQLEHIKDSGIKRVILCVGYLGDKIESYFKDGKKLGLNITYSYEKELLGTAGAIKNAEQSIDANSFIVMNGDTYTNIDFDNLLLNHLQYKFPITIAVTHATNPKEQELIELKERVITNFYKRDTPEHENYLKTTKMPLINAGIYIFENEILNLIPKGVKVSLEQEIFPRFINNMTGSLYFGYMKDLANIQFCEEFERDILRGKAK